MSYTTLPPYLQAICAPCTYVDTRINQIRLYTPQQVAQLCQQYHEEMQQEYLQQQQEEQRRLHQQQQYRLQQEQYRRQQSQRMLQPFMLQPQAQHFGYFSQVQPQAQPPLYDGGYTNVGMNVGLCQPANGSYNFGSQHTGYQHQAPCVPQNFAQCNFGGYNVSPAPPEMQAGLSASAPVDLTDDFADAATAVPAVASVSEEASTVPAPVPAPKSDPTAWRTSKDFLTKELNSAGGADRGFLFGSLKNLPAIKRNKYATAHWPTKEAALEDIIEMSQYFLDAAEMISYRLKWDRIEADIASGALSKLDEKAAGDELAAEKNRLRFEVRAKRQNKLDRIEAAQDGQWIDGMRKPEFERRFEQKASEQNKRKLKAERDAELDKERDRKKARAEARSKFGRSQTSTPKSEPKQPEAVAQPTPQPEPEWELNEEDMIAGLMEKDDTPAPEPESNQSEAVPNSTVQPEPEWELNEEEMIAGFMEEDTISSPAIEIPQQEQVVLPQEQVTAPSTLLPEVSRLKPTTESAPINETATAQANQAPTPITADNGCPSSSVSPTLRCESNSPRDSALGCDMMTGTPPASVTIPAKMPQIGRWDVCGRFITEEAPPTVPDAETTAALHDDGYDSLFENDED